MAMPQAPALPLAGFGAPSVPVPYAASRFIPSAVGPQHGIMLTQTIPGYGPVANNFYDPALIPTFSGAAPLPVPNASPDFGYPFGYLGIANYTGR